jgi:hypothetical protein
MIHGRFKKDLAGKRCEVHQGIQIFAQMLREELNFSTEWFPAVVGQRNIHKQTNKQTRWPLHIDLVKNTTS